MATRKQQATEEPSAPRHLRRAFRRLCAAAELPPIRFHDLRHSAATLLRWAGVEMEEVSAMLRHSSPAVTYHYYSHVLPDRRRVAAETLDRVLSEKAV